MYKLIIIDDEEKIASGMAQLFPWQNIGFEVVQVFTGARKALQYIAENCPPAAAGAAPPASPSVRSMYCPQSGKLPRAPSGP